MFGYILAIYLVIGIMVAGPLVLIGAAERHSEIAEKDISDNGIMFGLCLGALIGVVIWPYWVLSYIYRMYFVNDFEEE